MVLWRLRSNRDDVGRIWFLKCLLYLRFFDKEDFFDKEVSNRVVCIIILNKIEKGL